MSSDLHVTVGALLIGVLVTAVGYGITTMQTYLYMTRFPRDPRMIKWTVGSLMILDTIHVALSWHMIYYYLILNYNNPPVLEDSVWSFDITIVVTAVITVIAHCFYARRVFILGGRNWFLTILILVLSGLRIVFGCIVTAKIFELKNLKILPQKINPEVGTGLGAGTLADCVITVSLVYYLRKHKSGFNRLDSFLDKLTYWTVNNGFLTSLVGLVVIVAFSTMPDNMIYLSVHLLLSKLYANSLLATLNFRCSHRGRGYDTDTGAAIPMSSIHIHHTDGSVIDFTIGKDTQDVDVATTRSGPVVHIVTTTGTNAQCIESGFDSAKTLDKGFSRADNDFKADTVTAPNPISRPHSVV